MEIKLRQDRVSATRGKRSGPEPDGQNLNKAELPGENSGSLEIIVYGEPAPQGSKRAFVRGRRAVLVESSNKVKPWRAAVVAAARGCKCIHGPVVVDICFSLPRPKAAKDRTEHAVKPDLDKLARAVGDALTDAHVIDDDSRIVAFGHLAKRYIGDRSPHTLPALTRPGAVIRVRSA